MSYVPLGAARFRIVAADKGECVVIPARRSAVILLLFAGGIFAFGNGLIAGIDLYLTSGNTAFLIACIGIALATVFFVVGLVWFLAGQETLRVVGKDLEIGYSTFGIGRRRLYRGQEVRDLEPAAAPTRQVFLGRPYLASVRFTYGSRTVAFAFGLDHAEATEVVAWLRKRLPGVAG